MRKKKLQQPGLIFKNSKIMHREPVTGLENRKSEKSLLKEIILCKNAKTKLMTNFRAHQSSAVKKVIEEEKMGR